MLSYISKFIQLFIGLSYTPVMIRLLGQSEYGLYNIAASIISYLGILNFGFGSAYMRFYSRYKVTEDKDNIATLNGMFLGIFVLLGVLATIAGIIIASNVDIIFGPSLSESELNKAQSLMFILVLNLGISFPNVVFDTYIQANERFVFQNVLQILRLISTPLINLPILLAGYGSIGLVIGITIVNITVEMITMLYCIRSLNMKITFNEFDWILFKEMSTYSIFIFMNLVVNQVNDNADKTILGRYQGTSAVAIYSVAANLKAYYQNISGTIVNVFTPRVHRMEAQNVSNHEMTELFTKIGRVQFVLLSLVSSGLIFFGLPFIKLWAGISYSNSYYIALLLILPATVPLIQNIGIEIQRAKNMHQFRSWLYLAIALGNILISIPLSTKFGGIGAALGTAIAYIIGNGIIMNLYYEKKVGLDIKYFWNNIMSFFPALIAPIIYGVFVNYFFNIVNAFSLIVSGVIYIAVFLISMWCLGLNNYEKEIFRSPFI